MEIESREDFIRELERLEKSYNVLCTLAEADANFFQGISTWETLQLAFSKSPANNSEDLNIPMGYSCAYYFAKKLLECLDPQSKISYELFKELQEISEQWNPHEGEISQIEELIANYISTRELDVPRSETDRWCSDFYHTYKKIISITEKYQNRGVPGDIMHAHHRYGNAALILEFLYTKYYTTLSLVELQNCFINQVVLASLVGKDFLFMTETQYTIAEILNFNRYELFAWYITNEMHRISPIKNEDPKQLLEELNADCQSDLKNIQDKSDAEVKEYYREKLHHIKHTRKFTEKNIFTWLRGLLYIRKMYDHYRAVLGKSQAESKLDAEGQLHCRGMILGDSVSVGLGLYTGNENEDSDQQCYTKILPRLLKSQLGVTADIANCSVIGYKTTHGMYIIKRELEAIRPDFVLISLGGNDALQQSDISTIQKNLEKIISDCIGKTEVIIALGIPQTRVFNVGDAYRKQFADILVQLKQRYKNIETIWLPTELLHAENIQKDGIHFKSDIQLPLAKLAMHALTPVCINIAFQAVEQIYHETATALKPFILDSGNTKLILNYLSYRKTSPVWQKQDAASVKEKDSAIISQIVQEVYYPSTATGKSSPIKNRGRFL